MHRRRSRARACFFVRCKDCRPCCASCVASACRMEEFDSFVASVTAQLRSQLLAANGDGPWQLFLGFLHAVDFTEHWIRALLAFHALLALAALCTTRSDSTQAALFFFARASASGLLLAHSAHRLRRS